MRTGAIGPFLRWLGRGSLRVEVSGNSMGPTLEPGDRLLVVPAPRIRPGQLVVLSDPRQRTRRIVKRVRAVGTDGRLQLAGDNVAASTDSRHFGRVPPEAVLGRVVYRYGPEHRRGRIAVAPGPSGSLREGERR